MTLTPRQRCEAERAVTFVQREGAHWEPGEWEPLDEAPVQMPVRAWR